MTKSSSFRLRHQSVSNAVNFQLNNFIFKFFILETQFAIFFFDIGNVVVFFDENVVYLSFGVLFVWGGSLVKVLCSTMLVAEVIIFLAICHSIGLVTACV